MNTSTRFRRVYAASLALTASLALLGSAPASAHGSSGDRPVNLAHLGTYAGEKAEIVAYDWITRRAYVTTADGLALDILDVRDPARPVKITSVDLSAYGTGAVTSVDARHGLIAAAVESADAGELGKVVLMRADGTVVKVVTAGYSPDMVTFTGDGRSLLVANEGEPVGYQPGQADPEGSVSIVSLDRGVARATVRTADFRAFDDRRLDASVRTSGPGATVAQDLEPEYISVSRDGRTAFVTLQENNAVATVDLRSARVTSIDGLGFKDHSKPGNGLDTSDRDGAIRIEPRPLQGVYMPDSVAAFEHRGRGYYVVANEGDEREYGKGATKYVDGIRLADLDPALLPAGFDRSLLAETEMGRLNVLRPANAGDPVRVYGGRSFSIRDEDGRLVYDSGDLLERLTAEIDPANFNAEGEGDFDKRSDNKGPEPEGLTIGEIDGKLMAFVAIERTNGVMVFDISDPRKPRFQNWVRTAGDESPEGLEFVPAWQSPTHRPMLAVANEGTGTTSFYTITR
ncbi:choice-of-anchor I family protein [Streptomyces sp. P9(2023)]|uniref:choice-of-anchor I family protein n=1 Tax=Streptomyces sp. P9(2023) TaxID=3064394 RepID=UPI0028F43504|nr:choice-of-anchor I family protein [Streptomyces sp. P9(2023)]MDT9690777.1 choice-of-anchor I family protein [Streptomyces sp. P9(2023)]